MYHSKLKYTECHHVRLCLCLTVLRVELFAQVYIDQKDQNDYTGLESYVSEMIEEEDMNFYPLDKALCMEEEEEEVDPFRLELDERQIQLQEDAQMMNKSLAELRDDNTTNHENTMGLVKHELFLLKSIFDEIEVRKLR